MKNIAIMLRKEGKTGTKLYADVEVADNSAGRLNLQKLEVNGLSDKQKRQLKSMKFSRESKTAVDAALSNQKTAEKRKNAGHGTERY
jgi:hypothetical protein